MVLYEYPLNESIRTLLRLEHLFDRFGTLSARDASVDHHFALATLFEIVDVGARADLRAEVLKELDRQRAQLNAYRGNPSISETALDAVVARVTTAYDEFNQTTGKPGQNLSGDDWLTSLRSRIVIPGGTCSFDLPAYHAWQHQALDSKRAALDGWAATLAPLQRAVSLILGLLRDAGVPHKVMALGGIYQQNVPTARSYHLLRLRLDHKNGLIPEISGHRLMVSIRLMRHDAEGRLRPSNEDASFELALCG